MNYKSAAFFILLFLYSVSGKTQSVEKIIDKYVEYIGGKGNWKKIQSMVTTGTYEYGGMKFNFTSYSKAPNLYKYIVTLNGKYYAQAFDGASGWKIDVFNNETQPTIMSGKDARAMANESDVELQNIFVDYKKKGHKASLEGRDTIDNKSCFKIKFIRASGEEEFYFFDAENVALVKKKAVSKNAELNNAFLETFYSDYRGEQGIKIPFKSISKLKEQVILTISVDSVKVNVPIDKADFEPKF